MQPAAVALRRAIRRLGDGSRTTSAVITPSSSPSAARSSPSESTILERPSSRKTLGFITIRSRRFLRSGRVRGVVVTVRDDVEAERAALADSLEAVGPQAQTACSDWTAFDLAAHVVAADRVAGVLAFCVRALAARGVQFSPKPELADWVIRRQRRDGYHALIARLRERSPRLLLAPRMATFSLFELWMHHDDLTAANGIAHAVPEHLAEAIPWLVRYQAKRLPAARLVVRTTDNHEWTFGSDMRPAAVLTGPTADLVRWLAGRLPVTALNVEAEGTIAEQLRVFVGTI